MLGPNDDGPAVIESADNPAAATQQRESVSIESRLLALEAGASPSGGSGAGIHSVLARIGSVPTNWCVSKRNPVLSLCADTSDTSSALWLAGTRSDTLAAVSYTHLTLPTIYSV